MKNIKRIIVFFLVSLGVLLLLLPIVAQPACCDFFDLSKADKLGNAIGGLLGTGIALMGVVATFLAFLIQVKANKDQVDQFNKTFQTSRSQEKLLEQNRITLFQSDIRSLIHDLCVRKKMIEDYISRLEHDPYSVTALGRLSTQMYKRLSEEPREKTFIALSNMGISDPARLLEDFYSVVDLLPGINDKAVEISDDTEKDIAEEKINSYSLVEDIYQGIVAIRSKGSLYLLSSQDESDSIYNLFLVINQQKKINRVNDTDFKSIYNAVLQSYDDIMVWCGLLSGNNPIIDNLQSRITDFTGHMEKIPKLANQNIVALKNVLQDINAQILVLQNIQKRLSI